jgi:cell division protein FtsB
MRVHLSEASEQLIFHAVEERLAKLDALIDATHAMMDASQAATDAMARQVFELKDRMELLEEWARLRFEELSRERG